MDKSFHRNRTVSCFPKKRFLTIGSIILVLILTVTIVYNHSPYHYSNVLVSIIETEDKDAVAEYLNETDFNVNTPVSKPIKLIDRLTESSPDTPMIYACKNANYDIVKLLIEHGASANYIKGTGITPLIETLRYYQPDDVQIVALLLKKGADTDYTESRELPVEEASKMWPQIYTSDSVQVYDGLYNEQVAIGITEIVSLLLEHTPHFTKELKFSLLQNATRCGNLALIDYLLQEQQIFINGQDADGKTVLFAVSNDISNYEDTVATLDRNGIDKSIRDNNGKTAYDYAKEQKRIKLAAALKP